MVMQFKECLSQSNKRRFYQLCKRWCFTTDSDEIAARIIYWLCNLNVLKLKIVHEEKFYTDNEVLNENTKNNSSNKIHDVQDISENIA